MYRTQILRALTLLTVVLAAGAVFAGTTGKIAGVVTDQATGEPIIGAAVSITGAAQGALTDSEGRFVILNVPVGKQTVAVAIIGYAPVEVSDLAVSIDLTTRYDFALQLRAVELGTVTVTAERPLVQSDRTASLRVWDAEEIQHLPTRGYQDIVGLQAGVMRFSDNNAVRHRGSRENSTTGTMNLRGGRASEVAYYVDGFSQQDPLTGLSTTRINNNTIKEVSVVTGGFNAEYGMVMSGAVNVTTHESRGGYHGTIEAVTDNFHGASFDNNVYSAVLSGPLFPGYDQLSFYAAGERRWSRDREPRARAGGVLPQNTSGLGTWQGKVTWRPTGDVALRLNTLGSQEKWQEYRHDYLFNSEHMPRYDDRNQSLSLELTHTLGPKTFYTVSGNWFETERTRGDGVYFDDLWAYGRPNGNPGTDATQLYYAWDNMGADPDSLSNGVVSPLQTEVETETRSVELPDGSVVEQSFVTGGDESHVWDDLLKRQSSYVGADFDLISQINPYHEIKFGLEMQRHTLRRYRNLFPTNIYAGTGGAFDNIDYYGYDAFGRVSDDGGLNGAKNPINAAGYLQDKIEWEGLVVNVGVRFDYFDYKTERLRDPNNPLDPFDYKSLINDSPDMPAHVIDSLLEESQRLTAEDLIPSKTLTRLAPRLGVAFPVADGSVMHMSYGKFVQRPDLQNLYVNYGYLEHMIQSGSYFYPFGNPNLEPEETTAYEVGWRRQVSDQAAVDVTAFYKDIRNLTQVVSVATDPRAFATYRNQDFGTVKGVEFQFDMRRSYGMTARLNYTLSFAEGTGSYANSNENVEFSGGSAPKMAQPLDYDQRHKFSGSVDLRSGPDSGPAFGDFHPFARAGVNFVLTAGSGFPYTPSDMYNEISLGAATPDPSATINALHAPWTYQLDMRADRAFAVGNADLDLYLWVINVFDRENVADVYEVSGLPDQTGWLGTGSGQDFANTYNLPHDASGLTGSQKYETRQLDPRNYSTPRQIRFGARWSF